MCVCVYAKLCVSECEYLLYLLLFFMVDFLLSYINSEKLFIFLSINKLLFSFSFAIQVAFT